MDDFEDEMQIYSFLSVNFLLSVIYSFLSVISQKASLCIEESFTFLGYLNLIKEVSIKT